MIQLQVLKENVFGTKHELQFKIALNISTTNTPIAMHQKIIKKTV